MHLLLSLSFPWGTTESCIICECVAQVFLFVFLCFFPNHSVQFSKINLSQLGKVSLKVEEGKKLSTWECVMTRISSSRRKGTKSGWFRGAIERNEMLLESYTWKFEEQQKEEKRKRRVCSSFWLSFVLLANIRHSDRGNKRRLFFFLESFQLAESRTNVATRMKQDKWGILGILETWKELRQTSQLATFTRD